MENDLLGQPIFLDNKGFLFCISKSAYMKYGVKFGFPNIVVGALWLDKPLNVLCLRKYKLLTDKVPDFITLSTYYSQYLKENCINVSNLVINDILLLRDLNGIPF